MTERQICSTRRCQSAWRSRAPAVRQASIRRWLAGFKMAESIQAVGGRGAGRASPSPPRGCRTRSRRRECPLSPRRRADDAAVTAVTPPSTVAPARADIAADFGGAGSSGRVRWSAEGARRGSMTGAAVHHEAVVADRHAALSVDQCSPRKTFRPSRSRRPTRATRRPARTSRCRPSRSRAPSRSPKSARPFREAVARQSRPGRRRGRESVAQNLDVFAESHGGLGSSSRSIATQVDRAHDGGGAPAGETRRDEFEFRHRAFVVVAGSVAEP